MPVVIRNLTPNPIHVPLSSGAYVRVSPGMVSESLHEVEVQNNAKVEKLVGMRAIAVEPQPEEKARGRKAEEADTDAESRPKKK